MPRLALVVVCISVLGGCTLALSYPVGAEVCDGLGVDEDLDGRTDCLDSDCDGQCTEDRAELCDDGRDNDHDGRRDQEDLGCWPFAHASVARCESVRATSWTQSMSDFQSGWEGASGTVTWVPDPDDASRQVVQLVAMLDEHAQILGPRLAGGLEGATIAFEYQADRTPAAVGFVVDGADLRAPIPDGLFAGTANRQAFVAGSSDLVHLFETDTDGRWLSGRFGFHHPLDSVPTFEVTFDGHAFDASSVPPDIAWFAGASAGQVPPAVVDGEALRPAFATFGTALLRSYTISLTSLDPCAMPTDAEPHPAPMPVPQIPNTIVGLASRDATVCALAATSRSLLPSALRAYRSDDGGHTFTSAPVDVATSDTLHVGAAPMISIGDGFSAAVTWYEHSDTTGRDTTQQMEVVRSPDCMHWTREPHAELNQPNLYPHGLGYSVDAMGEEISLISFTPGLAIELASLLFARRAPGATGAFTVGAARVRLSSEIVFNDGFAGVQILHLGNDRALVYARDRDIEAVVLTGMGVWRRLSEPLLTPSHRVGTFDELLVSSPTLALGPVAAADQPPQLRGLIAFASASSCPEISCEAPSAVADFSLAPAP